VGVPDDQWAMECRAFKVTLKEKRAALEATRPHWAQMDPGTFERLSKGIDTPDLVSPGAGGEVREDSEVITVKLTHPVVPAGRPSTEDAREMIGSRIDDLEMRGVEKVTYADFADLVELLQRHRTWVYLELDRQAAAGRLIKIEGDRREYGVQCRASNGVRSATPV
jgi:hypothetical protein